MGTIHTVSPEGAVPFGRTYFFANLDEAIEALRAADALCMGYVLRNREDLDDESLGGDSYTSVWILELSGEPPTHAEMA